MPRKLRDLIRDLKDAGFYEIKGGGKGSHRKFIHLKYGGAITLSWHDGDDAKHYQEKQVKSAIETIQQMKIIDQYHKWIEWSDEDNTYIGKCPDLISGIHGNDPIALYKELCDLLEEVIQHFQSEHRVLPPPSVRPMQEVV